jgi:hypothetical protein
MLDVLGAEPLLANTASGYAEKPDYRPLTKFENRGLRLGHGVWDLVFSAACDRKRRPEAEFCCAAACVLSHFHLLRRFSVRKSQDMSAKRRTVLRAGAGKPVWVWRPPAWPGVRPARGRKIILGQSVPLTGAASEIGLAFAAGAKLYVDAFNARKKQRRLDLRIAPAR